MSPASAAMVRPSRRVRPYKIARLWKALSPLMPFQHRARSARASPLHSPEARVEQPEWRRKEYAMSCEWQKDLQMRAPLAAAFLPPAMVEETGWDILLALYSDRRSELSLDKL